MKIINILLNNILHISYYMIYYRLYIYKAKQPFNKYNDLHYVITYNICIDTNENMIFIVNFIYK